MFRPSIGFLLILAAGVLGASLQNDFRNPPREFGVRCWWWWLNGNVTKEAITRDLEEMHKKGFSGAMIFDAGGADQRDNMQVPAGPLFGSPEWIELYLHALEEAKRLELELGLSIQSGWNLGGPNVTPDFAAKQLVWSEAQVTGPVTYSEILPQPKTRDDYYRDICILAYKEHNKLSGTIRKPIKDLILKSSFKEIGMSAPDTRFLLNDHPSVKGEEDVLLKDVHNISSHIDTNGKLTWEVPEGNWRILRFGYTLTNAHVSTYSGEWKGMVIDYLSRAAFERYWSEVVNPILVKTGPFAETVLKRLETDSWECGGMNWSPDFAAYFKKYRGYDPISYLPVIAGKIVENRRVSNAFLADFRKTLADCVSDNHYKVFAELAAKYKLSIQPESGGPHAGPIDGIKNYQHSDIVMSEFWVPSPHRPTPPQRFFVKQAASAAHIYGKKYVGAESFTSIGPHWNDTLWKSQKPSMDHEFCSGLNMIFFHTFTCSPKEMGLPGQEYFAGTHINPQVTWWDYADTFITYINRVQSLVQRGTFVADVLYYYGDHVPNIASLKESDPAGVLPGYDYDVTDEDTLLKLKVDDGQIVVPGGIRYRLLVLPDHGVLSLKALQKVEQLVLSGASVLGPKPQRLVSLVGGNDAQKEFRLLADTLWPEEPAESGVKTIGRGRLAWGQSGRQFLHNNNVLPDFEAKDVQNALDYIHYVIDGMDVYFVSNQTEQTQSLDCSFRVSGRQPELWNPVTGNIQKATAFQQIKDRTTIPLQFDPFGSLFVVFNKQIAEDEHGTNSSNYPVLQTLQEIKAPWQVSFDPAWDGPESIEFSELTDWSKHADEGIKFYSGKASYKNTFILKDVLKQNHYWLQLNDVEDVGIAAIRLNGKDIGTVWTKPWRTEITEALSAGKNQLEITVVNSWRNRLVGDRDKPQTERYTKTNITIRPDWELLTSGLLGPVQIKTISSQDFVPK